MELGQKILAIGIGVGILLTAVFGFLFWRTSHNPKPETVLTAQSQPNSSVIESLGQNKASTQVSQPEVKQSSPVLTPKAVEAPAPAVPTIDPSTFSQYDKYKDGETALYADIKSGTGAELVANQRAMVYYKGWLTNGQMFDQSQSDAQGNLTPFEFTFGAGQVIKGWEQAMADMKVGGTRLLIVPPAVGYGSVAQGPIPPNSVLVFTVQLLAVQ